MKDIFVTCSSASVLIFTFSRSKRDRFVISVDGKRNVNQQLS